MTRVAVVTGASSGIGKEAAKALAAQGFRVIGTGRDAARMAAAAAEIRAAANGADVTMLRADLSLLAGAAALADEIAALTPRIDILLNNAGGIASDRVMTAEGYEQNYAVNHLGPFVLTQRLLPLLRAAAVDAVPGSVRIINTASDASEMIPGIDLDDVQNLSRWSSGMAYCSGKLANVLHAKALAEQLAKDGIVVHAMYPGPVVTRFYETAPADTRERTKSLPMGSAADGADTLVWLATADMPGTCSGKVWENGEEKPGHPLAADADFVARFWAVSETLVARGGY